MSARIFSLLGNIKLEGMDKVEGAVKDLERKLQPLQKTLGIVGRELSHVGATLTKTFTLPLIGAGAAVAKVGIDFETAFAGVRKTVDATEEELQRLSSGLRELSKEMPQSAADLSAIAEAAGQLGIKTENILGFTKTMAMLGDATNLSSTGAATALSRFANIVGMSQDDFGKLGSVIVGLGNNFATTEAEIVSMGMRLAGAGSQIGMTESEIMAFSTALSSVGISAEAGGTAFSKIMMQMQVAVETSNEKLNDFASVAGMTAQEFQTAFSQNAASAIQAFLVGLGKTAENGDTAIAVLEEMGITEIRLRDALLRGANAAELFGDAIALGNKAWEDGTALQNEAAQRYQTTAAQLKMLRNALVDVGIEFSGALLPVLRDTVIPMLHSVAGWVGTLAGAFTSLPEPIQHLTVVLGAAVAAAPPLLLVFGKMALTLKSLIPLLTSAYGAILSLPIALKAATIAFGKFAAAAAVNPLTWVVAGSAALITMIELLGRADKLNRQTQKDNAETDRLSAQTEELSKQANEAKKLREEYEKMRGQKGFDPAEMERLTAAHEDAVIALKNHSLAMNGKQPLDEKEIENTRRRLRGEEELTDAKRQSEYASAKLKKAEEEEAKAREDAAKKAAEEAQRRREELDRLESSHKDAIDNIILTDAEKIAKDEQAALAEAERLKATEEEKQAIREKYALDREVLRREEEHKEFEAEQNKIKIREDAEKSWDAKLLQQSGDRLKILDAEYAAALAEAHEQGADLTKVDAYYAEERVRIQREIADKRFEEERNLSIALQEEVEKQTKAMQDAFWNMVNFGAGVVNKIGGLFSQMSRNEEQRLSKQYADRKKYIEDNVTDEEERAAQLQTLQEEEDAARLEIQREQAARDKALGVFNTVVDTAAGIVRALANPGGVAGMVMSGVIGALGAAQTGVIMSTPEPFYAGGLIQGSESGIVAQVGERNQDELIFPLDKGVDKLADALLAKLDTGHGQAAPRAAVERPVHVNIGTLIADDRGLMELERRLRPIRIAEDRRTGARA